MPSRPSLRAAGASLIIRRLKLFWNLSFITALIPLSVGARMAVALHGARQLGAGDNNLHTFIEWLVSPFLLLVLVLSLTGLLVTWGLSRLIARPLEGLLRLTSGGSQEELETLKRDAWARPDPNARDEVGALLRATWDMVTRRTELSSEMHQTAHELVNATSDMANVARELASLAAEHASIASEFCRSGLIPALLQSVTEATGGCRQMEAAAFQNVCAVENLQQMAFQTMDVMKDMVAKVSLREDIREQASHGQKLAEGSAAGLEDLSVHVAWLHSFTQQLTGRIGGHAQDTSQLGAATAQLATSAGHAADAATHLADGAEQLAMGAQTMLRATNRFLLAQREAGVS